MRRNGGRRDVRASGVELLQSSCFVLSGVRSTLLKRNTNMAIVWTRSTGNTGLRPLRGYELKCVYAVYRGGGEVKEFDRFLWITPGTTSFFSLSLFYTRLSSLCHLFFRRRKREREARNFRIKIFEPYCFAYIFRFAISSGARLLYTKKQHIPGWHGKLFSATRSFEGFQNGHSVVFAMGHGNGKRQTLEGAIN